MFDLNNLPVPLTVEMAPLQVASNLDRLFRDLQSLENRPYEITFTSNCFDQVPREWSFTPMSDEDILVFGDQGHRITTVISDLFGEEAVSEATAWLQPTESGIDWNDTVAQAALVDSMIRVSSSAIADYLRAIYEVVGFDVESFISITGDDVSPGESSGVMMAWAAVYEMASVLHDPMFQAEVEPELYEAMHAAYDEAVTHVTDLQQRVEGRAIERALAQMLTQEDGK